MKQGRIAGIDIVKVVAIFFVITIHTMGQTHILAMDMHGLRAFAIIFIRYLVMSCVPLFLMITGYLQSKKTVSGKFYKGILPILATYLFVSIFSVWYNISVAQMDLGVRGTLISVLNFTANNYAWYVEMFIGLFLVIPFLNGAFHSQDKAWKKLLLIAILACFTVLPTLYLTFPSDYTYDIVPDYWTICYPITYYFIGMYFRDYQPKLNKLVNIVFIILASLVPTLLEFIAADGGPFADYVMNGFNSVSAFVIALLVFWLLYDLDLSVRPIRLLVSDVAKCSLSIYLFSNLVEKILYAHTPAAFPLRLPIMVLLVFVFSYAAAKVQDLVFAVIRLIYRKIRRKASES